MIQIVSIIGARPQFIKAAVLSRLIRTTEYRERVVEYLVHTGQHYDENMSAVFFRELDIPEANENLGVGGASHGRMVGDMLPRIEEILLERKPSLVLVYGDTNSTLAGALAAAKLRIPVAHVEAGLRSFNMDMPEEINRVLTDHVSEWLFAPTVNAVNNLKNEGIPKQLKRGIYSQVHQVGDVMYDASLFYRGIVELRAPAEQVRSRLDLPARYVLMTIHRAENTDDPDRLREIALALTDLRDRFFVLPLHPRARKMMRENKIELAANVLVAAPVGYLDMLELESGCDLVVTDSGGVQKEAYFLGKPCVTLRGETEWVETVSAGWNRLVGSDRARIVDAVRTFVPPARREAYYGDGRAGQKILDHLLAHP